MSVWIKCTRHDDGAIYVNLNNAISLSWSEQDQGTDIVFPGGKDDVILVKERPEDILKGENMSKGLDK